MVRIGNRSRIGAPAREQELRQLEYVVLRLNPQAHQPPLALRRRADDWEAEARNDA
jgi:hypothetical protein